MTFETIGKATLYLGDCREVLPTLAVKFAAVITDPPYGTQGMAGGYGRRQLHDKGDGMAQVIANDTDLTAIHAAFPLFMPLIQDGWAMVFYSAKMAPKFHRISPHECWFGSVVWDKGAPGLGYHIRYAHEDVAIYKVGQPKRPPQPLLSVLRAAPPSEEHPHEKPQGVMSPLCAWAAGARQDTLGILDPFMGSGSTGVAAVQLGLPFVGIELDLQHFDTACRRLEDCQRQERMFS